MVTRGICAVATVLSLFAVPAVGQETRQHPARTVLTEGHRQELINSAKQLRPADLLALQSRAQADDVEAHIVLGLAYRPGKAVSWNYGRALNGWGSAADPISWVAMVSMLLKGVPQENIVTQMNERGLGFHPSDHFLEPLQALGANDALVEAMRHAKTSEEELALPSDVAEAEKSIRDALKTRADSALLHYLLGVTLFYKENWRGAIAELRQSIKLNPNDYHAHYDLGDALQRQFPPDRNGAISECRKVVVLKPDWAEGYVKLASALWWRRDYDGMIAAYQTAVRLDPNNRDYHVGLGNAFDDKQDFEAARREFLEALRLDPKDDEPIWGLYRIAGNKYERGDVDGAIASYRDVLKLRPNHAASYFRLGEAFLRKGNKAEADDAFRRGCELDPKSVTFREKCKELSR